MQLVNSSKLYSLTKINNGRTIQTFYEDKREVMETTKICKSVAEESNKGKRKK